MSDYLKTVVTAVVAVSVITSLIPKDGFSKYINLLASIIVMAVVITPVFKFTPQMAEFNPEELELQHADFVADEFEKNLAEKIKTELYARTGTDFVVEVQATTDEIKSVRISPYSREYAHIVEEFIGVGEDRVVLK